MGLWQSENLTMQNAIKLAHRYALTEHTVLICGETGTGKEFFARAIHTLSSRCNHPFIGSNISEYGEGVLESELFGHVKGGFTGALHEKCGCFERAGKGTLFLDEFHRQGDAVMAKLLNVLQNRIYHPVGGEREKKLDARLIFGMNKHPKEMLVEGTISPDIYYRIARFIIEIPPLRERREDIIPLIHYFLTTEGFFNTKLSGEDKDFIYSYPFPGNVRELQNFVFSAIEHRSIDTISIVDSWRRIEGGRDGEMNFATRESGIYPLVNDCGNENAGSRTKIDNVWKDFMESGLSWKEWKDKLEVDIITYALRLCDSNNAKAARILGMSDSTLHSKMKSLGLNVQERNAVIRRLDAKTRI